jgi:PAS domain S-box-containing protein
MNKPRTYARAKKIKIEGNVMIKGKNNKNGADELRRKAEEKARQLPDTEDFSFDEAQRLNHELRVHQIELEMQNEALRQSQVELMESYEKYIDLYDFAPVGYLSIDEKGVILEANLTLAKQLEIERGSLIGFIFPNFIAQSERQAFRAHLARIFKTRESLTLETRLIRRKQGTELYALLDCLFVESSEGRSHCRISITDISDRKSAEEAAQIYMKRLERSNRELQDFAFTASHDLQEPLRKIQAFGAMIKRKYAATLDAEGCDYLDRIMGATKRMSDMVKGLLDYSRLSTRERPFAAVNLNLLIKEVQSDLEISIEKAGASIEVGRLPTIQADSDQMRRLFQNLISNALKFHGEQKPLVKIYATPAEDDSGSGSGGPVHRIFIEDNGIGFDEKDLDRIFTLFQRLHGRSAYEGTGMGLAICRKIVERHHGTITARSKLEKGATFIVSLPERQPSDY